jgi:hypothetical protein
MLALVRFGPEPQATTARTFGSEDGAFDCECEQGGTPMAQVLSQLCCTGQDDAYLPR